MPSKKKRAKPIREVIVAGEPFEVRRSRTVPKNQYGYYQFGCIILQTGLTRQQQLSTILHEYGEALFQESHDVDKTINHDTFSRMFDQGLRSLVRDNWHVIEALKEFYDD